MSKKRKILTTAALPYANGHIHLGHLVEYIQTDFWVRFQKMRGHDCHYMCADDTHGTPVMISAKNQGITPEELIEQYHREHLRDFTDFEIEFDNYYSTNSPENKELAEEFYLKMSEKGHIAEKSIKQLYCEHDAMFLPDRFVIGTCPLCKAEDQYGDSCDSCGSTYSPAELINPRCSLCNNTPVEKESSHIFFKLNDFKAFLQGWVKDHTTKEVSNKLDEWLQEDLRDWDISRDAPYFGFTIPGKPDKFFYVWLDAPIGYISSTKKWCDTHKRDFKEFWQSEESELYHFIGKDIVYFHTLFWPAMLKTAGYRTPNKVFVHGFLTINGEKMSKSKGTFIQARTYLNNLDPLYLRYYYATKMSSSIDDIDLNLDDFVLRVNAELIGKITNLASRSVQMLEKIGLTLGTIPQDALTLVKQTQQKAEIIAEHYENRDFSRALLEIRSSAEEANKYVDDQKPWVVIKEDETRARDILTAIINLFRVLSIYLKPIIPSYVEKVEKLLQVTGFTWKDADSILEKHEINSYTHLLNRIDKDAVKKMIDEGIQGKAPQHDKKKTPKKEERTMIEYNDFAKVELRVAKILEAQNIEEADKLLQLKISLGTEERSIIAGIKKHYKPEELVGKLIVVVANLQPRKMKFGTSEGMLLAASSEEGLFLLSPDSGAQPGMKIS